MAQGKGGGRGGACVGRMNWGEALDRAVEREVEMEDMQRPW